MAGGSKGGLRRDLGLRDVFAISTGAMFSSGLFLLPGIAFGDAGAWMILAYALSALMIVPAMLAVAELASAMPKAGGAYYFLDRSMGPLVGTVGGLGTWIAMGFKATFALIGIGAYLRLFVDVDIEVVAAVLAVVLTAINVVGTRETARLQRGLVWSLLAILGLFLFSGFIDLSSQGLFQTLRTRIGEAPGSDVDGILATVGLVFVSYAGLTKVAGVAEEVAAPERNILRGMSLSLAATATVYVLSAALLVAVVPSEALVDDLAPIATGAEQVFAWMPGRLGVALVTVAAIAAFGSTGNAGIMAASRYLLAMGRDGLIPRAFQRVGRFQTPTLGVVTSGLFVVVALFSLDVVSIAKLASAFQLLMFAMLNGAVIVMREARLDTYDPAVRMPLYPWVPLAGIFLSLGLIIEMGRMPMLFTLALTALGVGWYFVYGQARVERQGAILHWFERLGRARHEPLEEELWFILKEMGLRKEDPYGQLVERAPIVVVEEETDFDAVVRRAAERLATGLPMGVSALEEALREGARSDRVPVVEGVAMAHVLEPRLGGHRMVMVYAAQGVTVEDDEASAHALFFLISPAEDPGQHLRLLAKLATQVEEPGFLESWRRGPTEAERRRALTEDALSRLSRRLTRKLRAGAQEHDGPVEPPARFESILVFAPSGDLGSSVADWVTEFAAYHDARVRVAERIDDVDDWSGGDATDQASQAGRMDAVVRQMRDRGLQARWSALPTGSAREVVREVLRDEHDLVVLPAPVGDTRARNIVQQLLRVCPCPVWAIRPDRQLGVRRVLAAIDPTAIESSYRALNAQILSMARRVTEQMDAELHLVHALSAVGSEMLEGTEAAGGAEDWSDAYGRLVERLVQDQSVAGDRLRIHLLEGPPDEVIPEVVERELIDLVVLGSVGRTGLAWFFVGNTAESVLRDVPCAVLAVKPPGFETPLEFEQDEAARSGP